MDILTDLRISARRLVRNPLFTIIAVLTLGIGIGANSAIFTLVNGVLLRPLPFRAPQELVHIDITIDGEPTSVNSPGGFRAMRDHATSFESVAMAASTTATLTGHGDPVMLDGQAVSANYFDVLGVAPLRGRTFRIEENDPARQFVVMLGENLWRERFGGDESIIGRTIPLNDRSREVIGIVPAAATLPADREFWIPQPYTATFNDPDRMYGIYMQVFARLRPGVTVEQAAPDVRSAMEKGKALATIQLPNWSGSVRPLHEHFMGDARLPLLLLLGAVGFVLLIACANLANLLLAQATARATDFAVRRALGAGAGQLVRQLLVESVVLGFTGGVVGLLLGAWGAEALLRMMPPELPRLPGLGVDARVIAFTFTVSLLSALLFGLAPALQVRSSALAPGLRQGGRGLVGRSGARTRAALVLAETALAFALVIGAGLLIRTIGQLRSVDAGFDPADRVTFSLLLPPTRYETHEQRALFWTQAVERVRSIPGVAQAGAINHLPLSGNGMNLTFEVDGRPESLPGEERAMNLRIATASFFDAMGIDLVRGRLFDEHDTRAVTTVALLSEEAVQRHFPNEDPIGKRITMSLSIDTSGVPVAGTVVGIVGNVRHSRLRDSADPEIYFAAAQVPPSTMDFAAHTAGTEPLALQQAIADAVHQLDANLAVAGFRSMEDVVDASLATDRFMTTLLTAFSGVAMLLAAIGIFGVISYSVAQRRREIGVRMAVGASRRDVIGLVVTGALRLAGGGVVIGFIAALLLTRVLESLLYEVQPTDPVTFLVGGALLLAVAFVASMLPALSASRTPPAMVLNTE